MGGRTDGGDACQPDANTLTDTRGCVWIFVTMAMTIVMIAIMIAKILENDRVVIGKKVLPHFLICFSLLSDPVCI